MNNKYQERALISFQGMCPMNCKHCYTYDLAPQVSNFDISSTVERIASESCDIIYVSQRYENFYDEEQGYQLCSKLYEKYRKDIFIITRSYLSNEMIQKFCCLNDLMRTTGNTLFLAVSVCAGKSYGITEDIAHCPTPIQRLSNLERAHGCGIKTLLMLRPVFPNKIIPVTECTSLIAQFSENIDAVVTSGLIVTESILNRLNLHKNDFSYLSSGDSTYLSVLNQDDVFYLDVEKELNAIERQCSVVNIPCFRHSMPALNSIVENLSAQ